jgi:hypothetical protein
MYCSANWRQREPVFKKDTSQAVAVVRMALSKRVVDGKCMVGGLALEVWFEV